MVKYCLWLSFILSIHGLAAQSVFPSVRGRVVESTTGDPLAYVAIILKVLPDSNAIKTTISDSMGNFLFENIPSGSCFIEANQIGFSPSTTPGFTVTTSQTFTAADIRMVASEFLLQSIEVTAENPTYVNMIDRKVYFPENDIMAQSGTITDILQNIPSITMEAEGDILMRGSPNITFLLNGKPSGLLQQNSSVVLEQIPAHLIERIEIITNPSAKYKPDGTAGIINIITKKNMLPGIHGSIVANASTNQRYNGNISFNYNPGKVNISALYGYWQSYNPRTYLDQRIIGDSTTGALTYFDLNSESIGKPKSHTATFGIDYHPDDQNSFGLSMNYHGSEAIRNNNVKTLENNSSGLLREYSTYRIDTDTESELELSISAEHQFTKEDHTISMEAEYTDFDEKENSSFTDTYVIPDYPAYDGRNIIDKKEKATFLSIDYTNPLSEDLELEAGYEGEYSTGDLDYFVEYFDQAQSRWQTDVLKTNKFLYQRDIHGFYATLARSFDRLGVLVGLRAEQTNIESNLVQLDSLIPNDYFNLFPTVHLNYELGDEQEIGLSYSRRVNRPDPDELNPFPEYVDIRDIEAGNPYLKPEQVHSIELAYQYRNDHVSFLPTIYYRQTFDAFSEETFYINDSTLLTTLQNLSQEKSGGLELVLSWIPSKKLNFNLNTNLFYHTIDASDLGYEEEKNIVSMDTKLAAYINMLTATKLQLNATYRSAMLTAQGQSLPVYFLNVGLRQELFKRRASLTLTLSDVFNTMRWRYTIDTPLLFQEVTRKRKSQIAYLGFSWRFGISGKKNGEELLFEDRL